MKSKDPVSTFQEYLRSVDTHDDDFDLDSLENVDWLRAQ